MERYSTSTRVHQLKRGRKEVNTTRLQQPASGTDYLHNVWRVLYRELRVTRTLLRVLPSSLVVRVRDRKPLSPQGGRVTDLVLHWCRSCTGNIK